MAYPKFYPFKTRYLYASSTSSASGSVMTTVVPARAKFVSGWFATSPTVAQTATNSLTVAVNGTSIVSTSVTSSTGDSASAISGPSTTVYLAAGDVISVTLSSCVGGQATIIVQEF